MKRRHFQRTLATVLLVVPVLAACGGTQQAVTTTTAAGPATTATLGSVPATSTAGTSASTAGGTQTSVTTGGAAAGATLTSAPTITAGSTTTTESPAAATAGMATDTPTVPAPTVPPTITPAPTTKPFPLQAGWWDNGVCYEVFVRSFYDSNGDGIGDLNGLIQKLDYINDGNPKSTKSLGANCIWLMPIMAGPSYLQGDYHGYWITDFRKVDPQYGTNDDFKRFMSEAHKRGIHVLIDLVLNHTSIENRWFKDAANNPQSPYRDWYLWYPVDPGWRQPPGIGTGHGWYRSPSGKDYYYSAFARELADLNYRNPAVTKEAYDISRFWLQDMGVDGFRLDAVRYLIEDGATNEQDTPETHAWLRDYQKYLQSVKPDVFTVGEVTGSTGTRASYYPDQLSEYFEFDDAGALIGAVKSHTPIQLTKTISNTLQQLPFARFAPFLTNHDQDRFMDQIGNDVNGAKVGATALLTLPGLPFVYYGEEIGMLGQGPDPQKRTPLAWDNTINSAGFTTGSPWETLPPNYRERNVGAQNADPESLLNLYRKLIHLCTAHSALAKGDWKSLTAGAFAVGTYLRHDTKEDILIVLNFGKQDQSNTTVSVGASPLTPGQYKVTEALSSSAAAGLNVAANGAISGYVPLPTLKAETGYVFVLQK